MTGDRKRRLGIAAIAVLVIAGIFLSIFAAGRSSRGSAAARAETVLLSSAK